MNIEQLLDGLTWGELRAFVALGKETDADEEVVFALDDRDNRVSMFVCGVSPKDIARGHK